MSKAARKIVGRAIAAAAWLVFTGAASPSDTRAPRPNHRSIEYRLSWGIGAIRADRAYAGGASGAGVTIAVIDTGLDGAAPDVLRNRSPRSIDLIPLRKAAATDDASHGEQVAGIFAGSLDGAGTMGVAYGAQILAIRADIDGTCARQCAMHGADLARGIDYALANGARIILVPLVGPHRLLSTEAALERAAAAGAVVIAAAGNDSEDHPSWPARYASEPRYARAIIVAGASTPDGTFAAWSNRAGATAARFIIAPGEKIVTDCDTAFCHLVSGTSYSAAYVAGALALLLDRYPALGEQRAAELLLDGARKPDMKRGALVSGRGTLDVAKALRLASREPQPAN